MQVYSARWSDQPDQKPSEAVLTSTHTLCFEHKYEKYHFFFFSEIFQFLDVEISLYLNRRVFVMTVIKNCQYITDIVIN